MYAEKTIKRLRDSDSIVIYGAGRIARTVYYCMIREPYSLKIDSFLVSDMEGNDVEIEGVPVIVAEEWRDRSSLVLIAVMDGFLEQIQETLVSLGYQNVVSMTFESDLWAQLRGNYFRNIYKDMDMSFLSIEEEVDRFQHMPKKTEKVSVYVVVSSGDRKTIMEHGLESWETKIFAGAALSGVSMLGTEERDSSKICEKVVPDVSMSIVYDDTGENISEKNRTYCELTALYWIWKNDVSAYVGLSHYRRRFELDASMLDCLCNSDIDVALTIPVLNCPNVRGMYEVNHNMDDWQSMMEAVKALQPEYYETLQELADGKFYYGYNMLIAKREVLASYCEWLFGILEYIEERRGNKPRYIGYLAERLMGVYFLKNWQKYKIVHVKRHFMLKELP